LEQYVEVGHDLLLSYPYITLDLRLSFNIIRQCAIYAVEIGALNNQIINRDNMDKAHEFEVGWLSSDSLVIFCYIRRKSP